MSNKKKMIIIITLVVLGIFLIAGITYAYIASVTNEESINTGSGKLDISFDITESITGNLVASSGRDDGIIAVANAKLNADSVAGIINIYITPTVIDGLAISALKWEVEGLNDSSIVYTASGDFSSANVNEAIKIVDGYELKSTVTTFNIYIWLDGSMISTDISGNRFAANLSGDSVPITGRF
ncbi:MAG: hypothetical protein ACI31S_03610 [Bacilli bacterium]